MKLAEHSRRSTVVAEVLEPRMLLADDHPNLTQFPAATEFTIGAFAPTVIAGSVTGEIETEDDTDVFRFTAPALAGEGVVWVLQRASQFGELQPAVELRTADGAILQSFTGVNGAAFLGSNPPVGTGLVPFVGGETYWIVVKAGQPGPWAGSVTGGYQVQVFLDSGEGGGGTGSGFFGGGPTVVFTGGPGGGSTGSGGCGGWIPPDDYPDPGNFAQAHGVGLDSITANGTVNGSIDTIGDGDLFAVTAPGAGPTFFTVHTPPGSGLRPVLRVFDADLNLIRSGAEPFAGAAAGVAWNAEAGHVYYLVVEDPGGATGSYTVRVDAQPVTHRLYYPEGFASPNISEFIALANPSPHTVSYTITARYEWGERDQVIATGSIAPWSRGGVTIVTRGRPQDALVRLGVPYALEIASTGELGASLSHYDFGVSTGESFTEQASTTWTFAESHRDPDEFRDFLVFYNPTNATADLTITLYFDDHFEQTLHRSVGALRRGGVAFNSDGAMFRQGVFGIRIESTREIVAALTSFDIARQRGYALLGDPMGGMDAGVIPVITTAPGAGASVAVLNTTDAPVEVTLSWDYLDATPAGAPRSFVLEPETRIRIDMNLLGLAPGKLVGLRYRGTGAVTISGVQFQHGDADATQAATLAGTTQLFGDAYANPRAPGLYHESLGLYNPDHQTVTVSVTFLFNDGTRAERLVTIGGDRFRRVALESDPAILARPGGTPYSVLVRSDLPVIASMTHYDDFIRGGWGSLGMRSGFIAPLSSY